MRGNLMLALILLAGLTGCAGFTVNHDYDIRTNFQVFKTYDWTSGKPAKNQHGDDPIISKRVVHHVDRELAAKGFRLERQGDPDFLIAFTAVYRNRTIRSGVGFSTGFGVGPFRIRSHTHQGQSQKVSEGSMLLEIFDFKSKQVVWTAMAEGALSGAESPEEADAKVAAAARRMLEHFPPNRR